MRIKEGIPDTLQTVNNLLTLMRPGEKIIIEINNDNLHGIYVEM